MGNKCLEFSEKFLTTQGLISTFNLTSRRIPCPQHIHTYIHTQSDSHNSHTCSLASWPLSRLPRSTGHLPCVSVFFCLILQVKKLRLGEVKWLFWDTCNWAGHFGAFPRQDFPHIFCFRSSLKYLDNRIWCTFPELFCRCETPRPQQMEDLLDDYEHTAPGLLESKDWHR